MVGHLDGEGDLRMAASEFGDRARQEFERKRLAAGDAHGAAAQTLEILDLRFHALDVAALLAQVMNEHLAGGGQANAARPALEQLRAEFILQVRDAAVHRRRRDVELVGRLADRAGARDLVDVTHDAQVLHRTGQSE